MCVRNVSVVLVQTICLLARLSSAQDCVCSPSIRCESDSATQKEWLQELCRNASNEALQSQEQNFFKFLESSYFVASGGGTDCDEYSSADLPIDCQDIQRNFSSTSGVYKIYPRCLNQGFMVSCDMDTALGGWVVFQRRQDGTTNFLRVWQEYEDGFGDLKNEFWLGLRQIHAIVSQGWYELMINMEDMADRRRYALYKKFFLSPSHFGYTLSVEDYVGDAGDSLTYHNGRKFTTIDKDNDAHSGNCASGSTGAWWYGACHDSNLNGVYGATSNKGPQWKTFTGTDPLKLVEMKIRRVF